MRREAVVTKFKILFCHFHGGTEEITEMLTPMAGFLYGI
jgi:hypothetical protein